MPNLNNSTSAHETFEPDTITGYLLALTTQDRTTLRDAWGKRWTVKVFQVLNRHESVVGGTGTNKRVQAQMRVAVIAGPL